jgi:uncharacterized protein (TIGR03435 family)
MGISLRAAGESLIVAGLFAPLSMNAQPAPSAPLKFETASVKPSGPASVATIFPNHGGGCRPLFMMGRDRLQYGCTPLSTVIAYAFSVPVYRIAGPDWMNDGPEDPRFDILARYPAGAYDQVPEMLQSLLAERFHLVAHRGTREQSVDALVVANGGLRLKPVAQDTNSFASIAGATGDVAPAGVMSHLGGIQTRTTMTVSANKMEHTQTWTNDRVGTAWEAVKVGMGRQEIHLEAPSTTMEGLADLLVAVTLLPDIADMTQAKGRYQFDLKVSLSGTANTLPGLVMLRNGPQTAAAIARERAAVEDARRKAFNKELLKVGLQLEPRSAPVDVVIVDRVDQSPTAN